MMVLASMQLFSGPMAIVVFAGLVLKAGGTVDLSSKDQKNTSKNVSERAEV